MVALAILVIRFVTKHDKEFMLQLEYFSASSMKTISYNMVDILEGI